MCIERQRIVEAREAVIGTGLERATCGVSAVGRICAYGVGQRGCVRASKTAGSTGIKGATRAAGCADAWRAAQPCIGPTRA
jgi:hypothetical protein